MAEWADDGFIDFAEFAEFAHGRIEDFHPQEEEFYEIAGGRIYVDESPTEFNKVEKLECFSIGERLSNLQPGQLHIMATWFAPKK